MIENYKVLLNGNMKGELVDVRNNIDYSNYVAEATASFKRMFTLGTRRRNSTRRDIESGGTYILTYADNSIDIVTPGNGDFVYPGFKYVSAELHNELLSRYSGPDIVRRAKWKPLNGNVLINENLVSNSAYRTRYIYRGSDADSSTFPGWSICVAGGEYSNRFSIENRDGVLGGIIPDNSDSQLFLVQIIDRDLLESMDRIAFKLSDNQGNPYPAGVISLGTTPLTLSEDGYWSFNGELPEESGVQLSIQLTYGVYLSRVEAYRD